MFIFANIVILLIAFVAITISNEVTIDGTTTDHTTPNDNDNDVRHNYNTYFIVKDHLPWDITREVMEKSRINTIISPFAVKFLLSILVEATPGGSTAVADEVNNYIIGAQAEAQSFRKYGEIAKALQENNNENYTLIMKANLFTTDAVQESVDYKNILATKYDNTSIEHLDFKYSAKAAETINKWSNGICSGPIINAKDVEPNTMLLLANINYFKGYWLKEFEFNSKGTFFRTPTQQVAVQYMESTDTFYYIDSYSLDAKMLRLPFNDPNISMFIVLPKTKAGLNILIQDLGNEQIKRMQWLMEPEIVHAAIPKFKFRFSLNLKKILQKLGVNSLFSENATLAEFTVNAAGEGGDNVLKVSNIFQKTSIDINEKGIEAKERLKYNRNKVKQFLVNRPFIFFIEDNHTKNILFTGQVHDPTFF